KIMIKNIFLLFSIFVLLFFQKIFTDDVSIKTQIPDKVSAGEEFTVELIINKGEVGGFAKLQQELPEGFTATAIENKNASFTFSDQKVKYIWMALPSENEFKISYK